MRIKILITLCCMLAGVLGHPVYAELKFQQWTTKNDAKVYFYPTSDLPMVDIRVVFDAGSTHDGTTGGLSLLTNGLMAEGAAKYTADQLAEQFENIGAQFRNEAEREMASFELRVLSEADKLNKALETFSLILNQPSFPENSLERERKRLLLAIEAQKQSPEAIADQAFFRALYANHPYGTDPLGSKASVSAIKRADLIAFYKQYYVGSNAIITVVGDVTRKQAEKLVEQLLAKLPQGKRAPVPDKVKNLSAAVTESINHPSTQTHILVGQPGISRKDPDFFALIVGNHILGGSGLVSRISEEIREKRGLAYSSYSYFFPMRDKGPFQLGLQTKNTQYKEALSLLLETLRAFLKDGPSPQELEEAKKNIIGGFALRLDSNKKIAQHMAILGFYNLPADFWNTYVKNINSVTTEHIKKAFNKIINTDRLITVIVGGGEV